PAAAVPVLELHPAVLDAHDRAYVAGLRVLDDHAEFYWQFRRPELTGVVRVTCQNIRTVTIIHPSDPRKGRRSIPVTPLRCHHTEIRSWLRCDLVAGVMRFRL